MINNKLRDFGILIAKGFCMGAADVVPGVSGGTMAFILGIYARLINAIKSFDLIWIAGIFTLDCKIITGRPHFLFLVPLGIGILSALLFFTRVVGLPTLIKTDPEPVYALFFGLIIGSIYVLYKHLDKLYLQHIIALISGIVFGGIVFNLVPLNTPDASWFIFFSGAIAICAMILPGISGSFILLILKKYAYIFNAIGHFQFSILIPFGLGAITGLLLFSRVLSYLLSKYYQSTILVITGMLIASLWVIWPFQHRVYETVGDKEYLIQTMPYLPGALDINLLLPAILLITGSVMVIALNHFARDKLIIGG